MKALICSAILASASLAAPAYASAVATSESVASVQNDLPPGCKYVLWMLICDDMPIP
ncbi:hypothetical protein LC593_35040 [Nostoc sp. CHAB 5844]|nr:hypothetical protein [Nostoc sp. CHAB 5844]